MYTLERVVNKSFKLRFHLSFFFDLIHGLVFRPILFTVHIFIINYFKIKYPNIILDIDLKKFTNEAEENGKRIYEFCNLKWNKKYLEFYKRKDLYSKTISFNQIRKKISIYDIKKYRPYVDLLDSYKNKYEWLKDT